MTMSSRTLLPLFALGIAVLGIGGYFYLTARAQKTQHTTSPFVVKASDIIQQIKISGKTKAVSEVSLAFKNIGIIDQEPLQVGDTVKKGETLAILQSGDLGSQLGQSSAQLRSETAKLEEMERGTRSEEIDVTKSQLEADQTALRDAQSFLINQIKNARVSSENAIYLTIDDFFVNPNSARPQLRIMSVDGYLDSLVEQRRMEIGAQIAAWNKRAATLDSLDIQDALAASADLHAYLHDTDSILTILSDIFSHNDDSILNSDTIANETRVGSARTNISAADTALTTAEQKLNTALSNVSVTKQRLTLQQAGNTTQSIVSQKAIVDQVSSRVAQIQSQLEDQIITAPFDGTITDILKKVAGTAVPGSPVVTLISNGTPEIEAYTPEVHYSQVASSSPARVTFAAFPGEEFNAHVVSIDPVAILQDGVPNFKVKLYIDQPDPRIKPGLTADIFVIGAAHRDVVVVPMRALAASGSQYTVTKILGKTPQVVPVTLGIKDDNGNIEITSGLSVGDTILIDETKQYRIVPN